MNRKSDTDKIFQIVNQFAQAVKTHGRGIDHLAHVMDLELAHKTSPLRLDDMLADMEASPDFFSLNVAHDIAGIAMNLNRKTGEYENLFTPRYSIAQ